MAAGGAGGAGDSTGLPDWIHRIQLDDLNDAHGIARRTLGLEDDGWILVRPDGYVAARGTESESLPGVLRQLAAFTSAAELGVESA